ncbi:MAG TPA: hypothetical protein VJ180_11730, partial [Pyrinomonadaceae bacterium]|nr:hypothetical protein [Pyrinomonadaceae bacterium]
MSRTVRVSLSIIIVAFLLLCAFLVTTRSFALSELSSTPTIGQRAQTLTTLFPHDGVRNQTPASAPIEGCVSCHGQIEPMHKYGATETLERLKDGKDAVGLTCTACHGGNPAPRKTSDDSQEVERVKKQAHVRPRFPDEWKREGKYTGANPERTYTLLARETWEFARF